MSELLRTSSLLAERLRTTKCDPRLDKELLRDVLWIGLQIAVSLSHWLETKRTDHFRPLSIIFDRDVANEAFSSWSASAMSEFDFEDIAGYEPQGFHPVVVGDIIDKRYTVVHKLGAGGSATVWLARDTTKSRYVALKILTAAWSESSGRREVAAHRHLEKYLPVLEYASIGSLYDSFYVDGPNGRHLCLSSELCGPSLGTVLSPDVDLKFRPDIVQQLSRDLISGISAIHRTGMIYNDFSPNNVLLQLSDTIHDLSTEDIYDIVGKPEPVEVRSAKPEGVESTRNCPSHMYAALSFTTPAALALLKPAIKFIDFAEVRYIDTAPSDEKHGVTIHYADPETLYWREKPTQASDIWSLACTLFELRAGNHLIAPGPRDVDDVKDGMVDLIGPLPETWKERLQVQGAAAASSAEPGDSHVEDMVFEFNDSDFGNLDEQLRDVDNEPFDEQPQKPGNKLLATVQRLKTALRSIFSRHPHPQAQVQAHPESPLPAPLPSKDPTHVHRILGLPHPILPLAKAVRAIGTWPAWSHLSVTQRQAKIDELYKLTECEEVLEQECDTGEPPQAPLSEEEATDFIALLGSMLRWERGERATAEEVAGHVWLRKEYGEVKDSGAWLQRYHRGWQFFVNGELWL